MARRLSFENNRIEWDFSSAEEVHVSQNIYEYVTEAWTEHNAQLDRGECTLIPDGIYYKLEYKQSAIMPLTPQVLIGGMHAHNMKICKELVRNISTGWLADYIDISSMPNPDGWGGWEMKGGGDSGLGRVWRYFICFPDPEKPFGEHSEIVGYKTQSYRDDFRETLFNKDQMPLAAVSNADWFPS